MEIQGNGTVTEYSTSRASNKGWIVRNDKTTQQGTNDLLKIWCGNFHQAYIESVHVQYYIINHENTPI